MDVVNMDLPEITEVKRLVLHPGDSLVVRVDAPMVRNDEADEIIASVRRILGAPQLPVIVLGSGMDVEVLECGS